MVNGHAIALPPRSSKSHAMSRKRADLPDEDMPDSDLPAQEGAEEDAFVPLELDLANEEASEERVQKGVEVIKSHLLHAPKGPGVYRMVGEGGWG